MAHAHHPGAALQVWGGAQGGVHCTMGAGGQARPHGAVRNPHLLQ